MSNELLLLCTVIINFGGVLLFHRLFGREGLFCWMAIATICANIEVLIIIKAFGLEQTLGNVLFASTFLVTDILSELYGKNCAKKSVHIGIISSISFIVISRMWLFFAPSENDWAFGSISTIFYNTPRLVLSSLIVYCLSQRFDVWAYHKWWNLTKDKTNDKRKFLWLRNNGSTLISQLINAVLFNLFAFCGIYDAETLTNICVSTYVIYVATSLLDTPFIYLARYLHERKKAE